MFSLFNIIIVAGGVGQRMRSSVPKQFLNIHEQPIIVHTINQFLKVNQEIQIHIAAPLEHIDTMKNIVGNFFPKQNIKICQGGETRFHSVKNALQHVDSKYVMVHDAVRPCIDPEWILKIMSLTEKKNNSIPFIKVNDSIRQWINGRYQIIDREQLIRIQTPQSFDTQILKSAYQQEFSTEFTDDASVWESLGQELYFCEGLERNIKITTPDDIMLASQFLKQ